MEIVELLGSVDLGSLEGPPLLFSRPQIEEDSRRQPRNDDQYESPFHHRRVPGRRSFSALIRTSTMVTAAAATVKMAIRRNTPRPPGENWV